MEINEDVSLTSESKQFKCSFCMKVFSSLSGQRHHETKKHQSPNSKKLIGCRICGREYTSFNNRRYHELTKHNFIPEIKQVLKCSVCLKEFNKKRDIMNHLSSHDIVINQENKQFQNIEEFQNWKISMEKETSSWFVLKHCSKLIKDYACHRSGSYSDSCTNQRKRKSYGSKKCGFFCPAGLHIIIGDVVNVTFMSTHIGHQCEAGYLSLSAPEKNEIANLMANGVSIPTIMDKIALTALPTRRLALVKTQDLRNIANTYGIEPNTVKGFYDSISDNICGEEMDYQDHSYVAVPPQKGKLKKKKCRLSNSHKKARSVLKNVDVTYLENDVWLVPSFTKLNEAYNVMKIPLEESHACKTKCFDCNTCIHEYQCSCPESSAKYNMCEHIHLLCIKKSICEIEGNLIDKKIELVMPSNQKPSLLKEENLKDKAKAALSGFIDKLDQFTSEAQLKKILETISVLENQCLALATEEKQLPPVLYQIMPLQ